MSAAPQQPASRSAFFVGYLPMPGRLALFLWCLLPLLLGIVGGTALALAIGNADPGDGGRLPGRVTLTGVVQLAPYPLLRLAPDAEHAEPWTLLVVSPGKNGAGQPLAGLDGQVATLTGGVYERDGFRLFELAQPPEPAAPEAAAPALAEPRPLGRHRIVGEIVDPKCYAGAMRPGDGKPHMMCGNRCLIGGIPPMAAVRDADGALTMVLLLGPDGAATDAPFVAFTSLPVALTGEMSVLDGQLIMRVDADGIAGL